MSSIFKSGEITIQLPEWEQVSLTQRWRFRFEGYVAVVELTVHRRYRWKVKYHGAIIDQGIVHSIKQAKNKAESILTDNYIQQQQDQANRFLSW